MSAMALPKMVRVRQRFSRPVVSDIPAATRTTLGACGHPIRGGDVVAIGTSSRGIANYATIVKATVDHLRELGAKPFIFPAMGSHGGGTPEGQLSVLDHYGISEKTMGVPCRATMEVVQVGDALGLPVWLEKGPKDVRNLESTFVIYSGLLMAPKHDRPLEAHHFSPQFSTEIVGEAQVDVNRKIHPVSKLRLIFAF